MERGLKSYDRESVKEYYKARFGDMLEADELRVRLPKDTNIDDLIRNRSLLVVWPGKNRPIFPYFQLNKGILRPEIQLIQTVISETSDNVFYSPLMICEWFYKPLINKNKVRPIDLLKSGNNKRLLEEAEIYGRRLMPKVSS